MKIEFKKNNKTFSFYVPSSWQELKDKDLLFLSNATANNDRTTATIQFFCYLNKIKILPYNPQKVKPDMFAYALKFKKNIFMVADRDIRFIASYMKWIYPNDETNVPMPYIIELPLKHIILKNNFFKMLNKKIYAPEKALTNISFSQFCHADSHFQNFIHFSLNEKKYVKSIEHLNKLIAALYTAKNEKFNPETYFNYLPKIETLNMNYKSVVYWYFMSCKKILQDMFPKLMSATVDAKTTNENYEDPFKKYLKLQSMIVKSPAELTIIKNQLAWDVFDYLETQLENKANSQIVNK